jgi:transposase
MTGGIFFFSQDTKIPSTDYKILAGYLDLISYINKKIKLIEAEIVKKSFKDNDIGLLKTIPGVGDFIAFLIKSEIDDISRFPSKEKLASYAGLVPPTRAYGYKSYTGRITNKAINISDGH